MSRDTRLKMKTEISQELLQECFVYSEGKLFWKERPRSHFKDYRGFRAWNSRYPGTEAGCLRGESKHNDIRCVITFNKKSYLRYQLIWLLHYGTINSLIDHKDCNTTNDRIENLRESTATQNRGNTKLTKRNTSGYKGVSIYKKTGKWTAHIRCNNIQKNLGYFDTPEEAHEAYMEAARKCFGEFARSG